MGKKLEKHRNENKENIRIGVCIEFNLLFDNIEKDFERLKNYLEDNEEFLNNQMPYNFLKQLDASLELIDSTLELLICDIDKEEHYCKYLPRYY